MKHNNSRAAKALPRLRASIDAVALAALLMACGGGGGGSSDGAAVTGAGGATGAPPPAPAPTAALPTSRAEAARFLTQSTFGPTEADTDRVMSLGYAAWIDEQLAKPASSARALWQAADAAAKVIDKNAGVYQDGTINAFWKLAIGADDQLRQRVTFALSQIFVISMQDGTVGDNPRAAAAYLDMLGDKGLGNYRQLLEAVATHPMMGAYLTAIRNQKADGLPTSKVQFAQASHPKPLSLFSHNDQQNTWLSFRPEGATVGWGGRLGDLLASMNSKSVFTSISAAGNAVWLAGQTVQQYQVSANGAIRMGVGTGGRIFGSTDVGAAMQRIVSGTRGGHTFEGDLAAVSRKSIDAELTLRTALKPASDALFGTPAANYNASNDPKLQYDNPLNPGSKTFNNLAQQLQVVARMIDASSAAGVGARRQVFFVSIGGFDSHDNENRNNADLMARLAHAMRYFDTTLGAMGAQSKVTAFTASDFGRTFTSNGDGTDHGWGAHHFVMGGAVKGGDLYGNFPVLGAKNVKDNNFDSSPNQIGNGSLIPETSVDQLGATLARWFGVSASDALTVFPNLVNFDVAKRDLGFMA